MRFFLTKKLEDPETSKLMFTNFLKKLLNVYKFQKYYLVNHAFDDHNFSSNFILTLPQRQQCFSFYNLVKKEQLTFTCGKFLNKFYTPAKFYKRSIKNIGGITMTLKKQYIHVLKRFYLVKILNFNYKQWLFWDKLDDTIHPSVKFFLHKKSYIPRWQGKRRIKRVVLRMLNKQ